MKLFIVLLICVTLVACVANPKILQWVSDRLSPKPPKSR